MENCDAPGRLLPKEIASLSIVRANFSLLISMTLRYRGRRPRRPGGTRLRFRTGFWRIRTAFCRGVEAPPPTANTNRTTNFRSRCYVATYGFLCIAEICVNLSSTFRTDSLMDGLFGGRKNMGENVGKLIDKPLVLIYIYTCLNLYIRAY